MRLLFLLHSFISIIKFVSLQIDKHGVEHDIQLDKWSRSVTLTRSIYNFPFLIKNRIIFGVILSRVEKHSTKEKLLDFRLVQNFELHGKVCLRN